ncbi:MAG: DUF1015 domain-containing protein [Actinomycetota bacterium]|nr:DUF1015 domain-containing protein [Actinomycetota bacterium]
MPELYPFPGVRFTSPEVRDLVCPPYDVISSEEQDRLYARSEHNAVRIELPRAEGDDTKEERYQRAGALFKRWLDEGVLQQDDTAGFYVYRQDFVSPSGTRRQVTGIIGALKLEEFGQTAGVLPHERTMPGPIEDRLTLMRACPVNVSPIYAVYRGGARLMPWSTALENRPTAARLTDEQGALHRLWVVHAPAELEMIYTALADGPLVIADGHHRYETALAYCRQQSGPGPHEALMCFCVDADAEDLEVLPYNRVFRSQTDPKRIAGDLKERFTTRSFARGEGEAALLESKSDHPLLFLFPDEEVLAEVADDEVRAVVGDRDSAWRDLDVVALHEVVFAALFEDGIEELQFFHDAETIRSRIDAGFTGGVLLKPLRAAEVIEVAKSGERMPQKASYFWPKALTGLVFRDLS